MTPKLQFPQIVRGSERTLEFLSFAALGHKPRIKRMEVIACFADIRGFTKFVQEAQAAARGVPAEVLREFFSIFPRAVLREAWDLEHNNPQGMAFQNSVRSRIFPCFGKRLGDGMLLVWKVDSNIGRLVKQGLELAILEIIGYVQEYYDRLVRETSRLHPIEPLKLGLGIGLASGEAWRLNYGHGQIDFAGSPLNLAARLQGHARPRGICVDASFASTYLVERRGTGEGHIRREKVCGIGKIPVWSSKGCSLWLRKRRPSWLTDNDFARLRPYFANPPYEERPRHGTDLLEQRGMCEADVETLLDTRCSYEARFASEAAQARSGSARLSKLIRQMESKIKTARTDEFRNFGQQFHEEIARLAGPQRKPQNRVALVKALHDLTTKIYPEAPADRREITAEHSQIAQAITSGLAPEAAAKMGEHLKNHTQRVIEKAFSESN